MCTACFTYDVLMETLKQMFKPCLIFMYALHAVLKEGMSARVPGSRCGSAENFVFPPTLPEGDNRDGSGPVGSCHDPSVCSSSCFEFPLHSNAGVKKEGSAER